MKLDTQELPVVSVITVCWNAAATLEACIRSIAGQTYPAIEYIVVDGASTDGTATLLARHRAAITTLVSEPDHGIYDAMNKGIGLATGAFVLFMNADDFLADPRAIADAMAEIARAPDGDVFYGSILVRQPSGTTRHDPPPPEKALEEMVLGCLPHQATFARRAVFEKTGRFDLRWRRHADYDWWLKVLADPSLKLRQISRVIASFALGGASSDLAKGQPEVFAIQNSAAVYTAPEWVQRRLEMFQRAQLAARMEVAELRAAALAASQPGAPPARPPARPPGRSLRQWVLSWLPRPLVTLARKVKHRALSAG